MPEDEVLLRRLHEGDPSALAGIYLRYKDDLLTVARCLVVDSAAAEDVLHDVIVSFAGAAGRLSIRGGLKGYLIACTANRARDLLRRRPREPDAFPDGDPVDATAAEPAATLIVDEEAERLGRALADLPYEQRETIVLHLQGGLTFREIARQQEASINTVQSRYRYGLSRLREILCECV